MGLQTEKAYLINDYEKLRVKPEWSEDDKEEAKNLLERARKYQMKDASNSIKKLLLFS